MSISHWKLFELQRQRQLKMAAATAAVVNAVNDCFSIGSTVLCTTCFKDEVEGEVLAFDHNTKMLILSILFDTIIENCTLRAFFRCQSESFANLLLYIIRCHELSNCIAFNWLPYIFFDILLPSPVCALAPFLCFSQIECHSKTAEELNDVYVMNLSLCSNVQVIKECNGNFIDDPQKLNLEQVCRRASNPFICYSKWCFYPLQVKMRLRKTVERRQDFLKSKNADVSPEAQELYRAIAKQLGVR